MLKVLADKRQGFIYQIRQGKRLSSGKSQLCNTLVNRLIKANIGRVELSSNNDPTFRLSSLVFHDKRFRQI